MAPPDRLRQAVRVLVAGNDPLARGGLASLLGRHSDLQVVGEAPLSEELAAHVSANRPQVMAWDVGGDPQPALGLLRQAEVPVLALLADESQALDVLEEGARGILMREAEGDRMAAALHAMVLGLVIMEESLSPSMLRSRPPGAAGDLDPLTARELQALQLLAQGKSNKEIAQQLGISEHTAKFHVNSILSKLGAQSRTEAVVVAARRGLVIL